MSRTGYRSFKFPGKEEQDADGSSNVGELLKEKAEEGVKVLMLVWDELASGKICDAGLMGTHDEETRAYFEGKAMKSSG